MAAVGLKELKRCSMYSWKLLPTKSSTYSLKKILNSRKTVTFSRCLNDIEFIFQKQFEDEYQTLSKPKILSPTYQYLNIIFHYLAIS